MHLAPIIRTAYHSEQEEAEDSRQQSETSDTEGVKLSERAEL